MAEAKKIGSIKEELQAATDSMLPDFIASNGAKVVIAGGMGAGAVNGCNARGMQVITGVTGSPDDAALLFAKGELKSTGSVCSHHGEHHHGEGHPDARAGLRGPRR